MISSEPPLFQIVEGIIQYGVGICPSVAEALNLDHLQVSNSRGPVMHG